MPCSTGKDTTDAVDPDEFGTANSSTFSARPLRQIPYHQNHPKGVPPDLVDAAKPIEIVEPVRLQRLDCGQPALWCYLDHDGIRPAT